MVSDMGFDGVVLQIALKGITPETGNGLVSLQAADNTFPSADPVLITAQAGEDWDSFVAYCVERDLAGIECLSGIPGFVGGTPVQNVGAYGQEVSETIVSVRCLDRSTGDVAELTNADCCFSYRTSIFNSNMRDRFIVLSVTYQLKKGGEPKIVYKDLISIFGGTTPSLIETRAAVLRIRRAKSMVIDADDPNSRSAGSFFKNPIVKKEKIAEISAKKSIGSVPYYIVDEHLVKVPAAWLIENAGFQKGFSKGRAGLSTKHALAIVNLGGATAANILDLMTELQLKVKNDFDIELKPEPIFIGF